jgi:uncharacterized membrane protein
MNEEPHLAATGNFRFGKLAQYFLQGLLIIAPVTITLYTIFYIVSAIDSLIPIFTTTDSQGRVYVQNYGLGFLIVIAAICITGYFSSFFIKSRLFSLFDSWLEKAPGIRFIYSTVKDFFEAFAGEKKKFNRPVLANIDDNDVWRMGFITQRDMSDFGFDGYVAVYIPASYSIAGNVFLLPAARVKPVTNISATEAMKFAISGGVAAFEEEKHSVKKHETF